MEILILQEIELVSLDLQNRKRFLKISSILMHMEFELRKIGSSEAPSFRASCTLADEAISTNGIFCEDVIERERHSRKILNTLFASMRD
jgi:hypothetical protein